MKTLISMTDFVLTFKIPVGYYEDHFDFLNKQVDFMGLTMNYAEFLKQPLTLGMLVPCDENENVLEEPVLRHGFDVNGEPTIYTQTYKDDLEVWEKAKEKVLFKGFHYKLNIGENGNRNEYVKNDFPHVFSIEQIQKSTVEGLLTGFKKKFEIELTESAIKQIGI